MTKRERSRMISINTVKTVIIYIILIIVYHIAKIGKDWQRFQLLCKHMISVFLWLLQLPLGLGIDLEKLLMTVKLMTGRQWNDFL